LLAEETGDRRTLARRFIRRERIEEATKTLRLGKKGTSDSLN
jgi:hypothetical protein